MAADIREGGSWTPAQRLKNDALYLAIRAALAFCSLLPAALLRALGKALGLTIWLTSPKLRALTTTNLAVLETPPTARRVFTTLGALLGDTVAMLDRAPPPLPFAPGSEQILRDAIAEGRGVLFASAHLGPWEQVAASLVQHGIPLTVVAREPYDPRLAFIYERLRRVKTIYRGASGAGVGLVRVLRKKEVLGIPMDLVTRAPSIDVPFLGRIASTPIGPARLAIRTNAVVVVGTASPNGMSFVRLEENDETSLTAAINAALGERIKAMPEAWPWMHNRWGIRVSSL